MYSYIFKYKYVRLDMMQIIFFREKVSYSTLYSTNPKLAYLPYKNDMFANSKNLFSLCIRFSALAIVR